MLTRCPYQSCSHTFEVPDARYGTCASCGKLITFRPAHVMTEIERGSAWLKLPQFDARLSANPAENGGGLFAIVEDVRSLWNVGSIFRTADGAGVSQLILCGITGTPPRKEIAKTSLGAEESVPWSFSLSALQPIEILRARGVKLLALECTKGVPGVRDSMPLEELVRGEELAGPVCFIVGNEVTGVSIEVLQACDAVAHLPMRGLKESLNVAVAFGIAAYLLAGRPPLKD